MQKLLTTEQISMALSGMNISRVARESGVSYSSLIKMRDNLIKPHGPTLAKISKYLIDREKLTQ